MLAAPLPDNEMARLAALHALSLLDTPAEERFDRVTRLARRVFGAPVALVTLVDHARQWFKSCPGLAVRETPRAVSLCSHAILGDEALVVPDARLDPRFKDNPLVTGEPHLRFYAGHPLRAGGHRVGTLCVIDRRPRVFDEEDRQLLRDLAGVAEAELTALGEPSVDELTGVSNRRGFEALAHHALAACRRRNGIASILLFDLDELALVNTHLGLDAGDRMLRQFAQLLLKNFREADLIGRLQGDKFVVLACDTPLHATSRVLNRVLEAVQQHNARPGAEPPLRYSVGAVEFVPGNDVRLDDALSDADAVMLENKMRKRGIPTRAANTDFG